MTLYIGLISGTSMDGIDAVLADFGDLPRVLYATVTPYAPELKVRLERLVRDGVASLDELGELDVATGLAFADAARRLLNEAGLDAGRVVAIGSHGQTVRHGAHRTYPFSLQIGDPSTIAERTGITTVADFRRRDLAAGGEGAPLLPAFHAAALASPGERRAILNLGGIANLTRLCPGEPVIGFDSGPANCLLDAWYSDHFPGSHDAGGAFAGSGRTHAGLLEALLAEPYFGRTAPKSTGRELFDLRWLRARAGTRLTDLSPADVQATLVALTVESIVRALATSVGPIARLLCCGGGVHNAELMRRLSAALPEVAVETTAAHGLDPDYVEATGFAWLSSRTLAGKPGNLPTVTGARGERILGGIYRHA